MSIHYCQPTCKQAYRQSATNEYSHPGCNYNECQKYQKYTEGVDSFGKQIRKQVENNLKIMENDGWTTVVALLIMGVC